jgi:hypothetical protein
LHLGVKGDAVPAGVREIGYAFNTVLAYRDVTQKIVYDNYQTVRSHLAFLNLSRRATHHSCLRRFLAEGLEERDRVPEARHS